MPATSPSPAASTSSRMRACWTRSSGLVEWPVVLMGSFDEAFLDIPAEAIRATIRANQKCFVLREGRLGGSGAGLHPGLEPRRQRRRRRRSPPATSGWCGRACRTRSSSGRPTRRSAWKTAAQARQHRLPREARHAGRADRPHRRPGAGAGAAGRRRSGAGRARRPPRQGRPRHRDGRRVPRASGADGPQIRGAPGRARQRLRGHRGALQAARPLRPGAERPGLDRGGARRQARHAGRVLGDRREADGEQGPVRAAPGGAGRDPADPRPRPAPAPAWSRSGAADRGARRPGRRGCEGPPRLLRRPPEGLSPRPGRPPRPDRRRLRPARPGRPADGGPPGRGARRHSSTPRTEKTCSPATSARPTSCASRRRRTAAPTMPRPTPPSPPRASRPSGRWPRPWRRRGRPPRRPWRARISPGPCRRSRPCARRWTRSSRT